MNRFLHGHATHPDWRMALAIAAAQVDAQRQEPGSAASPTLGWVYVTSAFASQVAALLDELRQRWPGVEWVGASGVGIAASGVEYSDEPALSLMLCDLPAGRFRVFSGARPLADFAAHTAQVHADPGTADLADLIHDMSGRVASGYLFGGLASASQRAVHIAGGPLAGGLSGVAFDRAVGLVSRVTQGCQPIGPEREVTAADRNVVITLDGEPALDCLLRDVGLEGMEARVALPRLREVLVGLSDAERGPAEGAMPATQSAFESRGRRGAFGTETRVRQLIGLDPGRRGIAIGDAPECGTQLAFCSRNVEAARRDLRRICAEVREEIEPETLPPWRSSRAACSMRCQRPRTASKAPSTSVAPVAAARTSARPRPNWRWCAMRWATCLWSASLPAARSRTATSTATPAC